MWWSLAVARNCKRGQATEHGSSKGSVCSSGKALAPPGRPPLVPPHDKSHAIHTTTTKKQGNQRRGLKKEGKRRAKAEAMYKARRGRDNRRRRGISPGAATYSLAGADAARREGRELAWTSYAFDRHISHLAGLHMHAGAYGIGHGKRRQGHPMHYCDSARRDMSLACRWVTCWFSCRREECVLHVLTRGFGKRWDVHAQTCCVVFSG